MVMIIYFILKKEKNKHFNPLAHEHISNHRISIKFIPHVKGQKRICLCAIGSFFSTRFEIIELFLIRSDLKFPL